MRDLSITSPGLVTTEGVLALDRNVNRKSDSEMTVKVTVNRQEIDSKYTQDSRESCGNFTRNLRETYGNLREFYVRFSD